jgi:hypothetical protein
MYCTLYSIECIEWYDVFIYGFVKKNQWCNGCMNLKRKQKANGIVLKLSF